MKQKFKLPPKMTKKLLDSRFVFFIEFNGELVNLGSSYPLALTRYHQLVDGVEQDKSTFAALADRYFREVVPKKAERTQKDNLTEIVNLLRFFATTNISEILPAHIGYYLESRQANTRGNREISLFSHIFNCARGWGYTSNENPCRGIKRNKEFSRNVYVSDELFERLYQSANNNLRNALKLAYYTGQRPADVLKMKWADVYTKDNTRYLFVHQNKRGKKLSIVIEGKLDELLSVLIKNGTETILGLNKSQLKYHFGKARRLAGIKSNQFQFVDLRAKRGTDIFNKYGLEAAKELLGHADERMTRVYIRNEMGDVVRTKT